MVDKLPGLAAVFPRDTKASLPRERRLLAERRRKRGGKEERRKGRGTG